MQTKRAISPDAGLVTLARNQHGVVSAAQLRELGLGAGAVKHRSANGRLHRVHRGVYAVGHPGLSQEGRWMAAVLATGPNAVLSHRSAAALWRLMPSPQAAAEVEVTIPSDVGRRKRPGIRLHRSQTLTPAHTTRRHNIPATTPGRTLEDLRPCLSEPQFNAALRQAEIQGFPATGVAIAGREPTRSELEARFMRLCRRHRLPLPEVNAPIGRHVVDFPWRYAHLAAEGFEVLRFSWRQVAKRYSSVCSTCLTSKNSRTSPSFTSA